MNQKRSRDRDRASRRENNRIARHQSQVKQIERCDPQLLEEAKSLRDAGATRRSPKGAREMAQMRRLSQSESRWQRFAQTRPGGLGSESSRASSSRQRCDPQILGIRCRSYFGRGVVWGVIVSFTAVFSALGGSALTQIESVERAIARTIEADPPPKRSPEPSLTRPLNVLLIEAVADNDAIAEPAPLGRDSKLVLLRLEPQLDYAQIINIPLDSSVHLPGYGRGIVRDADRLGGTKLLTQVVSQLAGLRVDRYVRTSPEVVRQLLASGAIVPNECSPRLECADIIEQIARQQTVLETIRQRLKVPRYATKFQKTLRATQPDLDTNLPLSNLLSMAYFVRELEPDSISVDLVSKYVPGRTIADRRSPFSLEPESLEVKTTANPQHNSVAVQNTTNNPELGMRVVAYLRQQNFRDVYLVEHLPLKLEQTRIVADRSQTAAANRIQQVLGFGNLKGVDSQQKLILQIGKDARNLPLNY